MWLWTWQRIHRLWLRMRPTQSSSSKWWWWWPTSIGSSHVHSSEQAPHEEEVRLVVVHAGGTVLRAGPSLTSAKVGALRRGEVVTVLKEESNSRRVHVRTWEGTQAWISTSTQDGIPIVRRVTASTSYKAKDMPVEGTSSFADAFEARWQEKWQRLRVDADRQEATPKPPRLSSLGIPLRAWRPTGKTNVPRKAGLRPIVRRRPTAPKPVPKLDQPASSRSSMLKKDDIQKSLPVPEEELPDLIGFDTWPGTGRESSSDVPSLVELLGGRVVLPSPKPSAKLDDPGEELPKHALIFNTEPARAPLPIVADAPPTRGFSIDSKGERNKESDPFEYLLQEIVADAEQQVEALEVAQEIGTHGDRTLLIDQPQEGDDQTAVEALLGSTNFSSEADGNDTDNLPGFQCDPLPRAWAKKSSMKVASRFQRYAKPDLQLEFDFEQFNDDEDDHEQLGAIASPEHKLAQEIADIKTDLDALVDQKTDDPETANTFVADGVTDVNISDLEQMRSDYKVAALQGPDRNENVVETSIIAHDPLAVTTEGTDSFKASVLPTADPSLMGDITGDIPDLSLDPFFDTSQHQSDHVEPASEPIRKSHEDLLDLSENPLLDISQEQLQDLL